LQGRGFSVWSFPHAHPAPYGHGVDTVDQWVVFTVAQLAVCVAVGYTGQLRNAWK
jgi:hypothetical protein